VGEISIRDAHAADRDFVVDTARRFAAFGPPPWRSASEVVGGEVRSLDDYFDGRLAGPSLLIAEQTGGDRLGFVFLERAVDYFSGEPHGHIGMVAVAERAEGRGAGAALMRAAEAWARASGYAKLTLNVFDGNARARAMYERLGYRVEILRYTKAIASAPE
jgi:ribosomal protein S18 acetylase RimI-like enzyme